MAAGLAVLDGSFTEITPIPGLLDKREPLIRWVGNPKLS